MESEPLTGNQMSDTENRMPNDEGAAPPEIPHIGAPGSRLRELTNEYERVLSWAEMHILDGTGGIPTSKSIELARLKQEMANLIRQGANPALLPQGLTVEDLTKG